MIGSIRGKVLSIDGLTVLIELNSGLGYDVEVPGNVLGSLTVGEECFLYIHHVVREDAELLYGFNSKESRMLFREVIKINGVGPKIGMALLSTFDLASFISAVSTDNIKALVTTPGIGRKTAERIVVELKDRLSKLHLIERIELSAQGKQGELLANGVPASEVEKPVQMSSAIACGDAIGALINLGFKDVEAMRVVKEIYKEGMSCKEIVTSALKILKPKFR